MENPVKLTIWWLETDTEAQFPKSVINGGILSENLEKNMTMPQYPKSGSER